MVLTDWPGLTGLDPDEPAELSATVRSRVVIDGRHCPDALR